jgi:hypothetical protein
LFTTYRYNNENKFKVFVEQPYQIDIRLFRIV